jgi:hypothetical protein
MNKIIYYYQTFIGLNYLEQNNYNNVSHINVSSIHFGKNEDGSNYIHLNNEIPDSNQFDSLWKEIENASQYCKIYLMVGGAGGAYQELFSDFENYYELLYNLIKSKSYITGIDLDIEEEVQLKDIQMLIRRIKQDFGTDFEISMAPVASSLTSDTPGMGGFVYKDLYESDEGKMINHFNVQVYYDFSCDTLDSMIKNGYPNEKLVMGMISSQNINNNITEIGKIIQKYGNCGGVFNWEYFDSPPGAPSRPDVWCEIMNYLLRN